MRDFTGFLLTFICSLMMIPTAQGQSDRTSAQERRGSITGRVTDTSESVLPGAKVELQPAGVTAVADSQGYFFMNGLDPGSYTLTITYVGFTNFTKNVHISAGQVANVDAKLEVASQNLEVLVTAERAAGEAEAVNRQINAENILQVLPADVIRSLPNANMADAVGRLPSVTLERDEGEGKYVQVRGTEPRLTNVTINGINVPSPESGVRQIKLDAIPADIVESVEINKTLQANMDPDGIGGSVNLVTKTAGERPTVSLSGMGGYTPIVGGRSLVETAGTVGKRFGTDKRLGVLIGGSYDWNGRGIDDIEPVPDQATNLPGSPLYFDSIDLREYRYHRTRWGLAGGADYKLAEGSSVYIRGFYSDFKNFGDRWVYSLNDNSSNTTFNGTGGNPSFNTQIRLPDYGIGSVVLGGKHVRSTTWFAWDVSASRSRQLGENDPTARFKATGLSGSSCQFDPANTQSIHRPQWLPVCFTEAYTNQGNFSLTDISGAAIGLTAQLNLQVTGAVAKNYHLGSHLATIEVGGKFRNEHKFDNSFTPGFSPAPGAILLNDPSLPSRFSNSNYYDGSYKLGPNPSYNDVLALVNKTFPNAFQITGPTVNGNNFDLIEKVSAGYLMNTINFSRVRFVAGVRFEGTNLDTLTFDNQTNTLSDKANGSYLKILPSASLRVSLINDTDLRLVYGRGLSRPDPQDIAQSVSFSTGGTINTASLGNPALKAETANNYDVLIEHSLKPFGVISAGFFYKDITDPIVTKTFDQTFQPTPAALPGLYRVTQPINAGSAWVTGFEAAYLQHLTFLPGVLSGFGISANYGYTASQASGLFNRADHPRLLRSAPHTWNISPTYDRGHFSFRAGLSYNAANIFSYVYQDGSDPLVGGPSTVTPGGIKGPLSDIYLYPHLQIDMQGSVGLKHGLSFVAYVLNLNNEVFGFYQGSSQYMIQREYYKPTYAAGFRWSPLHEK
jgi:TonB-dependent receptor